MIQDEELAAIRARRMHQMQQQPGGNPTGPSAEEQEQQRAAMEETRSNALSQLLDSTARARLSTLSLVKPQKARAVQDLILRMAQTGQIRQKLSEGELVQLLERVSEKEREQVTKRVVIQRRRGESDDEDEDYGF